MFISIAWNHRQACVASLHLAWCGLEVVPGTLQVLHYNSGCCLQERNTQRCVKSITQLGRWSDTKQGLVNNGTKDFCVHVSRIM